MSLKPYPKYKNSGVAWLGDVPEHWEVKAIKRLSPVQRGASPRPIEDPKYFDDEGEYAWVRIADVSSSNGVLFETTQRLSELGSSLSVKINPGEIFISIAGTVGKPCISAIKACIHDGFVYFPKLETPPIFLYRIFEAGVCYAGLGKFGTQLNLNTETIGTIQIALPPNDDLAQIINFLDHETRKIDALIAEQEKLITLLAEKRQATISHAVTKGLNPRASMKDSGVEWLGEVPAHWRTCALKHFCDIRDGTHDTPKFVAESEDSFPFITSKDLSNGKIDFSDTKFISLDDYLEVSKRSAVVLNDVLMPMIGSIGGAVVVNETRSFAIKNVALFKNSKKLDSFWLSCLLDSNASTMQFDLSRSGGVQGFVGLNTLRNLFFAFPPPDEQYKIGLFLKKRLEEFSYLILEAENIISVLKERRTALISAAVTGKIDVRGWRA